MSNLYHEYYKLYKYGITGVVTNVILYLIFILNLHFNIPAVSATTISYLLGALISYSINRRWAFLSKESHRKDFSKFITAQGIGLICTIIIITLLIRWIPAEIAQIINIGITAPIIYVSLRLLKFGENSREL